MPRKYRFWFHYNKPASLKAGKPMLTVHYRGQCHIVAGLVCDVPTYSQARATQPLIVISGFAASVQIADGKAYISNDEGEGE